jgi:hypothetical protein
MNRALAICALLVSLVTVAASCVPSAAARELARNRSLWAARELAGYWYQLKVGCFWPPQITEPVVVEVRNGAPVSVTCVGTGQPAESKYFEKYDTVEELFAVIDDALARKAAEMTVNYDAATGVPARIYIDYVK